VKKVWTSTWLQQDIFILHGRRAIQANASHLKLHIEINAGTKTLKCWWLLYNNIKQTNCFLILSSH
jgi:hypothetical protein